MDKICNPKDCTGCYACFNICKHNAINFIKDELGFFRPTIDNSKCINCNLCITICPVNTMPELKYPICCYATTLKESSDILKSASGGAATAFMRSIIRNGGVVYGASDEDVFNVKHIRINKEDDIEKLRGSKYVQSSIYDTLKHVKEDLTNNLIVLFIGTPCQVAGLKSFLRKEYSNLFTVDLVCHGVPSQQLLNENIAYYNFTKEENSNIKISFRKKCLVEKKIKFGFFISNNFKHIETTFYDDNYMLGFLSCLTFRESCYSCRYATSARVSDITLADFWGLGNDTTFEKYKGVSLCLLNTEKGVYLFEKTKGQVIFHKRSIVEAIIGNGQLQSPSKRHKKHNLFRELYPKQLNFKDAIIKCLGKERIDYKYVKPLKYNLKKTLKSIIK